MWYIVLGVHETVYTMHPEKTSFYGGLFGPDAETFYLAPINSIWINNFGIATQETQIFSFGNVDFMHRLQRLSWGVCNQLTFEISF